jgi:hypothetical protein
MGGDWSAGATMKGPPGLLVPESDPQQISDLGNLKWRDKLSSFGKTKNPTDKKQISMENTLVEGQFT